MGLWNTYPSSVKFDIAWVSVALTWRCVKGENEALSVIPLRKFSTSFRSRLVDLLNYTRQGLVGRRATSVTLGHWRYTSTDNKINCNENGYFCSDRVEISVGKGKNCPIWAISPFSTLHSRLVYNKLLKLL